MVSDWMLNAAIGLMIGISAGILVQMKYVIRMDGKIEHLVKRVLSLEMKIEKEVLSVKRSTKKKGRK